MFGACSTIIIIYFVTTLRPGARDSICSVLSSFFLAFVFYVMFSLCSCTGISCFMAEDNAVLHTCSVNLGSFPTFHFDICDKRLLKG